MSRYILATRRSVLTRFGSWSGQSPRIRMISFMWPAIWSTRGSARFPFSRMAAWGSSVSRSLMRASYGWKAGADDTRKEAQGTGDADRRDDRLERGEARRARGASRRRSGRRAPERGPLPTRRNRAPGGARAPGGPCAACPDGRPPGPRRPEDPPRRAARRRRVARERAARRAFSGRRLCRRVRIGRAPRGDVSGAPRGHRPWRRSAPRRRADPPARQEAIEAHAPRDRRGRRTREERGWRELPRFGPLGARPDGQGPAGSRGRPRGRRRLRGPFVRAQPGARRRAPAAPRTRGARAVSYTHLRAHETVLD